MEQAEIRRRLIEMQARLLLLSQSAFHKNNKQRYSSYYVSLSNSSIVAKCPDCLKHTMIIRRNLSNGTLFGGCRNYPHCRGTMSLTAMLRNIIALDKWDSSEAFHVILAIYVLISTHQLTHSESVSFLEMENSPDKGVRSLLFAILEEKLKDIFGTK